MKAGSGTIERKRSQEKIENAESTRDRSDTRHEERARTERRSKRARARTSMVLVLSKSASD